MSDDAKEIGSKSESDNTTIHYLFDEVTQESSKETVEWILDNNFSVKPPEILNLVINSSGGSLHDAFAVIDIMASSRVTIRTVGLGQIASAGLMIFLAGSKGQRVLTPNTSIMSHQYGWENSGKHHELIAVQKEVSLTFERMLNHYKKHTSLSVAEIKKYLLPSADVYLSADDALKYRLCDKVSTF